LRTKRCGGRASNTPPSTTRPRYRQPSPVGSDTRGEARSVLARLTPRSSSP
jgi:hypothetical protein